MGLGLIFFGMGVMGDAMAPLQTYPPFLRLMGRMENPLAGILVGAVFTALVQSSSATTGVVIVMASQGFDHAPGRHRAHLRREHRHLRHGHPRGDRQAARGVARGARARALQGGRAC